MMRNVDLFNEYAALILARLYESFPIKNDLDVRKITGHADMDEFGAIIAPDGRRSKETEVAFATIEWLLETGYVRAEDRRPPTGRRSGRC